MKEMKHRMYGLVPYQLTGIQKGIQFLHAVVEYSLQFGNDPEYLAWAKEEKTVILLDGGTTNDRALNFVRDSEAMWKITNAHWDKNEGPSFFWAGTLNQHITTLQSLSVKVASFREPDLQNAILGAAFLLDERVWDRETYPDLADWCKAEGKWFGKAAEAPPAIVEEWRLSVFSSDPAEGIRLEALRNWQRGMRLSPA
jgi:hypothetical protein